jgi:hypothetical protein
VKEAILAASSNKEISDMLRNLGVAAALAVFFVPLAAHALQVTTLPTSRANLVQQVGFDRCDAWRDKCAWRWGHGTWRYVRCMRRHGC